MAPRIVIAVATAERAAQINLHMVEANGGPMFSAPLSNRRDDIPTHYWSSWGEHQWGFLAKLQRDGKATDDEVAERRDTDPRPLDGLLTFIVDDDFDSLRLLRRLGLHEVESPVRLRVRTVR